MTTQLQLIHIIIIIIIIIINIRVVGEQWWGTLWVRKGFSEFPHTSLLATCLGADPIGDAILCRTKIKIDGPNHVRDKEYTGHWGPRQVPKSQSNLCTTLIKIQNKMAALARTHKTQLQGTPMNF